MPVKFNIVERGNPSNREAPKKFYPSIQASGRVTTREMAEMAAQRSTLSTMDMMAAIESFMAIIPEQLSKGNIVELGDFGSFWLRTSADGAESVEEVRSAQITSIMPRFIPGKVFKHILDGIDFVKGVVTSTPTED
ncbi:MAG: HU family DNA-binding protein [Anaerolineales bacterium]|nr:HU family DNA-binding protein [Anaerolineales bacterium]